MRFQIVTYVVVLVVGLAGGFYLALYLQNQVALLAGAAIIFAFLTWLGSGAELLGLLREWYKEKGEIPKLSIEYDEKGHPNTYSPELQLVAPDGRPVCVQKYLRVCIRNTGGVARRCKAELGIIKEETAFRTPSDEPKPLTWGGPSLEKDIGGGDGTELLHIVFSDSRLSEAPVMTNDKNIFALVSTMDSLYPRAPFIRAQDGFGEGDFKVRLTVISEGGAAAKQVLKVHVERDFRKLSMQLVKE